MLIERKAAVPAKRCYEYKYLKFPVKDERITTTGGKNKTELSI